MNIILQTDWQKDEHGNWKKETLTLEADGRVHCTCLAQMCDKKRDYASHCRHVKQLIKDIYNNNLEKYTWLI